jgi:GTP cyclohydrolase FolE2
MSTPKGMQVDHIDHNSLNNQRYNLRNCTQQQNAFNKKLLRKYKGVFKCPCSNNFYAKIKFKRKQIYLGVSNNEIDAAHAYDRAAIKYFGEFACLNFPEEKGLRLKEMENER